MEVTGGGERPGSVKGAGDETSAHRASAGDAGRRAGQIALQRAKDDLCSFEKGWPRKIAPPVEGN